MTAPMNSLTDLKFKNTYNITNMESWKMQQLNDFYLCNELQESIVSLSGKLQQIEAYSLFLILLLHIMYILNAWCSHI